MLFSKILIANRGEIALRVIRTCRRLGIKTVAVYSEVDFRAPYVEAADEAAFIGPAPSRDSYLNQESIIATALHFGSQAVHPGYGFLSENAGFAQRVADAGLVFIGPPVDAIASMGDKIASKQLAIQAGVPVIPGHHQPITSEEEALDVAGRIGYPLLLKPAAGGGGRGMRVVAGPDELSAALAACRAETSKGFADDRIFIERYIERPRHIEIQILGDRFGSIIYLGERECSIQRRYQKVIEEAPSLALDDALRERMGLTACNLARAVRYTNAGTVEFILDKERNFYFLEMNTRLQVEHPVTEAVTSLDLVELQIRLAAGEALPLKQENVVPKGWAIEARVCAENPERGFAPTTGMVTRCATPKGRNIRVDSGIEAGSTITIYYDSLLAKVVAYGQTREDARQTLIRGLNGFHIEGLTTNVDFVNAVINHKAFEAGDLSTAFIEDHFEKGAIKDPVPAQTLHPMIMAAVLVYHTRKSLVRESLKPMTSTVGGHFVQPHAHRYVMKVEDGVFTVVLKGNQSSRRWLIQIDRSRYEVITPEFEYYRRRLKLNINGRSQTFRLRYRGSHIQAHFQGIIRTFEIYTPREWELARHMPLPTEQAVENILRSPMPGLVVTVLIEEGAYVHRGDELVRIESMKMESGIASPRDGLVEKIAVKPGQTVETEDPLLFFSD